MTHAIRFHKTGGPHVLQWEEVTVGDPGPGEARIRLKAVGVNYIDITIGAVIAAAAGRHRYEGAGKVDAVGGDVGRVKRGDRVGYCGGPIGTYCEARLPPADRLVKLPEPVVNTPLLR